MLSHGRRLRKSGCPDSTHVRRHPRTSQAVAEIVVVGVGDGGSDDDGRGTDAWVNEAPETGVLCVVSPSSSMAAGLNGQGGNGENKISIWSGRGKDDFPLPTHFISGQNC
jgi:hypothetical protein